MKQYHDVRIGATRREFLATAAMAAGATAAGAGPARAARRAPSRPTLARFATICHAGNIQRTVEDNRERMLELVSVAMKEKPDLVCLPETFTSAGTGKTFVETAEPLDGPTISAFSRKAKEGRCYVVCSINTREGDSVFNSAVVIDRAGDIAGVYHKACPVTTEPDYTSMEQGTMPGGQIPVFDLDFGRIGIQICFDAGFPENWQKLAEKGARAVLWPSAYDGGFPLRCYAYLHHYWVISSTRSGRSRIIDPCGEVLKETGDSVPIIHRAINLDYVVAHLDFNMGVEDRIKAKYGERVAVRTWDPGSAHFVVEPLDPTIRTEQIQREVGLEPTAQYHQRHREAYKRLRKGEKPQPQKALHGKRAQYGK